MWSDLCLIDSACIGLISPVHDRFSQYIMHLTCCCVMWSIFSDSIGNPSIWPSYDSDRFHLLWCDSTCVWLILLALDWFHLFMIYSSSISCIWPVVVWCDLHSVIVLVIHLFGLDIIDSTWCGVIQLVFDWFNLYWTDSICSWSIQPIYHAFDLLLCDVIYIQWL